MAQHRYHPREGADAHVLLFDDCEGCDRHATNLGLSLDSTNWKIMWEKMLGAEFGVMPYRSQNEAKLGKQMYEVYVALERYTTIVPARLPFKP